MITQPIINLVSKSSIKSQKLSINMEISRSVSSMKISSKLPSLVSYGK